MYDKAENISWHSALTLVSSRPDDKHDRPAGASPATQLTCYKILKKEIPRGRTKLHEFILMEKWGFWDVDNYRPSNGSGHFHRLQAIKKAQPVGWVFIFNIDRLNFDQLTSIDYYVF